MTSLLIWLIEATMVAIVVTFFGSVLMEWLKPAPFRNGVSFVLFGTGVLFMALSFCGIAVEEEWVWGYYTFGHVASYLMIALAVLDVMFWRRKEKLLHSEWIPSIYKDKEEFNKLFFEVPVKRVTFGYLNDYLDDQKVVICCYNPKMRTVIIWR